MKTRQETFNEAVAGLAAQGFERSMNSDWTCVHRGARGHKCAIGVLLPDDSPDDVLSFAGCVMALRDRFPDLPLFAEHDVALLQELQLAHDNGHVPGEMRYDLRRVAREFKLDLPEVLK